MSLTKFWISVNQKDNSAADCIKQHFKKGLWL